MSSEKHDIDNRASALTTTSCLLHRLKTRTLVHKRLQTKPSFTYLMWILLSTSLPGFADGDQQLEVNQTVPNRGQ